MSDKNVSIAHFLVLPTVDQIGNGVDKWGVWYDWFCKDKDLVPRGKRLIKKLLTIVKSPKIDPLTQYVFFKNNCPMVGKLYDSFSICDLTSGEVKIWVSPSERDGKAIVFAKDTDGEWKELVNGSWKDVTDWFGTTEEK